MDTKILDFPVGSDSSGLLEAGRSLALLVAVSKLQPDPSFTATFCPTQIEDSGLVLSTAMLFLFILSHFYVLEIRRERFLGSVGRLKPEVTLNRSRPEPEGNPPVERQEVPRGLPSLAAILQVIGRRPGRRVPFSPTPG